MGSFLVIIVFLIVIALLELQFHFTLAQILEHIIQLLTGSA